MVLKMFFLSKPLEARAGATGARRQTMDSEEAERT